MLNLKKIAKFIRRQLLKIDRVKHAVVNNRLRQNQEHYHTRWELIMIGLAIRDAKTEKTEALKITEEYELSVDYLDCVNWGGK